MSYELTNAIFSEEAIGNSLSAVNANYKALEFWTNNVSFSCFQYFDPLLSFYLFYGDFWKSTITWSYSISAPQRLDSFRTVVESNSASWVKPISFYYPIIRQYNVSTLNQNLSTAFLWFKSKYPIFIGMNPVPKYAENTTAYLYCLFSDEVVKVNDNLVRAEKTNCITQDRSATANCHIIYLNNVTCYGSPVCPQHSSRDGSVSCQRVFTAICTFENNLKNIDRGIIANINNYFKDRYEHNQIYCLKMVVKNCDWVWEGTL